MQPDGLSSYKNSQHLGYYSSLNGAVGDPSYQEISKDLIDRLESGDLDGAMELLKESETEKEGGIYQILTRNLKNSLDIILSLFQKNRLEKLKKEVSGKEGNTEIGNDTRLNKDDGKTNSQEKAALSAEELAEDIAEEALLIAANLDLDSATEFENVSEKNGFLNQTIQNSKQLGLMLNVPLQKMSGLMMQGISAGINLFQSAAAFAAKLNPLPKIASVLLPPITAIITNVSALFAKGFEATSNAAHAVSSKVVKIVEPAIAFGIDLAARIAKPLAEYTAKIFNPLAEAAKKMADYTSDIVVGVAHQCVKITEQTWNLLSPLIVPMAAQVYQIAAFSLQAMIRGVSRPLKSAVKFMKKVYKRLEDAANVLKRAIVGVAVAAWIVVKRFSEKLTSWVLHLLLIIWNFLLKALGVIYPALGPLLRLFRLIGAGLNALRPEWTKKEV